MVFNVSLADRLIFSTPDISNFCKSFVYLKGIADSDDILRQEIQSGIRRWDTENLLDENSMFFIETGLIWRSMFYRSVLFIRNLRKESVLLIR